MFSTFATCTIDQEISDICDMVHARENSENYVFAFSALKEYLKENFDFLYEPKVTFSSFIF